MMVGSRWRQYLALVMLCWSSAAGAGEFTLKKLMADFAEVEAMQATYREVKVVEIMDAPLISSGILRYRAPDKFVKEMRKPKQERLVIKADEVRISKADKTEVLSLDAHPSLRAFVDSFRATLAGDLASLQRHYQLQLEGEHDGWTLRLTPRSDAAAALVSSITLAGSGAILERIETRRTDGERSVMTIQPASR